MKLRNHINSSFLERIEKYPALVTENHRSPSDLSQADLSQAEFFSTLKGKTIENVSVSGNNEIEETAREIIFFFTDGSEVMFKRCEGIYVSR